MPKERKTLSETTEIDNTSIGTHNIPKYYPEGFWNVSRFDTGAHAKKTVAACERARALTPQRPYLACPVSPQGPSNSGKQRLAVSVPTNFFPECQKSGLSIFWSRSRNSFFQNVKKLSFDFQKVQYPVSSKIVPCFLLKNTSYLDTPECQYPVFF